MLLSGALSASFLLFTFYLQDELGIGPLGAGLSMLLIAAALAVAGLIAGAVVIGRSPAPGPARQQTG
ncbi:hypothetical protein PSA01_19770 [Pseudonocardia saturnea]|nr:hypothetical protein Pdca_47370 [Pseudonocardia autotrophica]GEC24948.1 hypothetical protein PSA01_19770 [Pseudonocardia saturnea]